MSDSYERGAHSLSREFNVNTRIFPDFESLTGSSDDSAICHISDSLCEFCLRFLRSFLCSGERRLAVEDWFWSPDPNDPEETFQLIFSGNGCAEGHRQPINSGCALCETVRRPALLKGADIATYVLISAIPGFMEVPEVPRRFHIGSLDSEWDKGDSHDYGFSISTDKVGILSKPFIPLNGPHRKRAMPLRYPLPHQGSQQALDMMKKWYHTCIEDHAQCTRQKVALPTRLLQLDVSSKKILLCETKDRESSEMRYATLSYCWGSITTTYSTTKANINIRREKGIFVSDLPQVAKDAIALLRLLDIKYLWMDALCIVQDDVQDWESEAVRMADVYGGSVITISALKNDSAESGFLHSTDLHAVEVGVIQASSVNDLSVRLFVQRRGRQASEELTLAPLSKRGWTLQERLLSPALIHFGRHQLLWECRSTGLISETGDTWNNDTIAQLRNGTFETNPWIHVINQCTQRRLSRSSDRFAAVDGIASFLRARGTYKGRYVAGTWEDELPIQLMWTLGSTRTEVGIRILREEDKSSPSWSWMRWWNVVHIYSGSTSHYESLLREGPSFLLPTSQRSSKQQPQSPTTNYIIYRAAVRMLGFLQRVHIDRIPDHSLESLDVKLAIDEFIDDYYEVPHFCIHMQNIYESRDSLVLRKVDSEDSRIEEYGLTAAIKDCVYERAGLLNTRIPVERFPNSFSYRGKEILTDGAWANVILV